MAKRKTKKLKHSTRKFLPELSAKEIRFCRHYAEHGSGIDALMHAGYTNATPNSKYVHASTLLRKNKIRAYIRELQTEAAYVEQLSFNKVVRQLARIALGPRRSAYDKNGNLIPPHEWDDDVDAYVVGIDTEEASADDGPPTRVLKVKFERRTEAAKELNRMLGFVRDAADRSDKRPDPLTMVPEETPE